jgi:thiamine-phosphate pyrophosphorylase
MMDSFTAGALRALDRAQARARFRGSAFVEPADLLAALADEPESRAATLLAKHGLDAERLLEALGQSAIPTPEPGRESDRDAPLPQSISLRTLLGDASLHARALDRNQGVGTEHLLKSLLLAPGRLVELVSRAGLAIADLLTGLDEKAEAATSTIPLAADIPPLELASPTEATDIGRILDASANRAREGLRVVEDYVRFVLDDPMLTRRLKEVRHRLAQAIGGLDAESLLGARDTPGDVGTHIMTPEEQLRETPRAVLAANFKRTTEALRALEEYSKLGNVWLAGRFETLRYDVYTLEKLTLTAVAAHGVLGDSRLYFIASGLPTFGDFTWMVGEALAGGVQVVQLREKDLPDRLLLERAHELRKLCTRAHARFIVNDRPDIAQLSGADGVHLGQDDLTLRDARRIVGPRALIGISTHTTEQIEAAVLEGAGYLGVGPVFPSDTKDFYELAGISFVRAAAEGCPLPWFALGGIDEESVEEVLEAGATRIAVSGAIMRADRPREAARALRDKLDQIGQSS